MTSPVPSRRPERGVTRTAVGFALRHAWRETHAAWRSFSGLVACVALGVAALVAVGTLARNLDTTLAREAKALLGGDVEVRATRPPNADVEAALARLATAGARLTRVRELPAMARDPASGRTTLVELKAVPPEYPLYGTLGTTGTVGVAAGGLVVGPDLLERLGLHVGDRITLGEVTLPVRGVLTREPDRPASVVSLGPRILLAPGDLDRTGLVQWGSRVRYRVLVRLPAGVDAHAVRDAVARAGADAGVRVVAYDDAQPGLRRFFAQLGTYLGLVGLVSLLVGGIGVAASITTFLRRRLTTIAILKTLGAESRVLTLAYLVQAAVLGGAGSVGGGILGLALQPLLVRALARVVSLELEARMDPVTLGRAMLMGLLVTLLAALWPLATLGAVKPSRILRRDVEPGLPRTRRGWIVAAPIAMGLAALALWQAGSLRVGGVFLGAGVVAVVVLAALARVLALAARLAPRARGPVVRHALANLHRPGGQSGIVVVSLGVGVMLLVAVALLERGLLRQLDHERQRSAPSLFFVDVQEDQRDRLVEIASRASGGEAPRLTAVVRSRLAAVGGVPVTRAVVERHPRDRRWYFTRDYVLTAMSAPPAGNVVLRGRWWAPGEVSDVPRVSLEEEAAAVLGVDVGGRLTFDVQGVPIEAEVANIRRVDWQSLTLNFFVIFSPGGLDGAPTTYVGTARVPPGREAAVQDAVVSAFPNVTTVAVRDLLERVGAVLDQLALAIRVVALSTIATGLAVMLGALAASRYQRLYESVILRTVGATRATVARTFALEYGCLGATAGLGGTALAALLAWLVLRFVLVVPVHLALGALAIGVAATTALAVTVGFLATFRLLGVKPLAVLRQE